jgi:hypothetical protein
VDETAYLRANATRATLFATGIADLSPGDANPIAGPVVWVGLRQHTVTGCEGFDWDYLASLWPVMRAARADWITTRPGLPAAHDRAGWRRNGAPDGLGFGFGHREAIRRGVCMFGARFRLAADVGLGDLVEELNGVADLLLDLGQRAGARCIG